MVSAFLFFLYKLGLFKEIVSCSGNDPCFFCKKSVLTVLTIKISFVYRGLKAVHFSVHFQYTF